MVSSPVAEKVGQDEIELKKDDQEPPVYRSEENMVSSPVAGKVGQDEIEIKKDDQEPPVDCSEQNMASSPVGEKVGQDEIELKKDDQEPPVDCSEENMVCSPVAVKVGHDEIELKKDDQEPPVDCSKENMASSPVAEKLGQDEIALKKDGEEEKMERGEPMNNGENVQQPPFDCSEQSLPNSLVADKVGQDEIDLKKDEEGETILKIENMDNGENDQNVYCDKGEPYAGKPLGDQEGETVQKQDHAESSAEMTSMHTSEEDGPKVDLHDKQDDLPGKITEGSDLESRTQEETSGNAEGIQSEEKEAEPVFDGTEVPGTDDNRTLSFLSFDLLLQNQEFAKDKAVALTNFVKEKGVVAASTVSTVLRRFSVKRDETGSDVADGDNKDDDSPKEIEAKEVSPKTGEKSTWNPLSYIIMSRDVDVDNNSDQKKDNIEIPQPMAMTGRVILYTRLGCQESKKVRLFLYRKRLRYVEINIDLYPGRKQELEKLSGSSAPKVFFNEILIGGLSELEHLDETGKLDEKIDYVVTKPPSSEAPSPPLSGEDDVFSSESIDDLAVIVRKIKGSITVKDQFYKLRWFTKCFLGSEAVDFISEDQYLEREEAVEFGRKLADKLFFRHVLDENVFEDGNHLYRFLDDDPIVSTQCHNIPRGIIDVKPRPIADIASKLRFLSYVIFEAYTSEDGRHVDYKTIHGSEEFARYLRTVQELQRVEINNMPREEKLAFFINLYNMMAIHSILVWGYPIGPLERRKMFGDFKYVIAGYTYSLSAIQNGILRANQRPPYNLLKPFGMNDKRSEVALLYPEPLTLFALVSGSRSGPALRCYSPANIDIELTDAAQNFLRSGGLVINLENNVVSTSSILKWFSVDFGKNEIEVLRHSSNYLEPKEKEALLELVSHTDQLKVMYQPYDWGVNC